MSSFLSKLVQFASQQDAALTDSKNSIPDALNRATANQWKIYGVINDWTRAADNKAGLLLTAEGILMGGTINLLIKALPNAGKKAAVFAHPVALLLFILAAIALLVSVYFCLECIRPKTNVGASKSLIFFQHIAKFKTSDDYGAEAKVLGEGEAAYQHISAQVWANSRVATRKHEQIALAIYALKFTLGFAVLASVSLLLF